MDPRCCATPNPPLARTEDDADLAALCHALASPHRVFIVRLLLAQESCFAGDLASQLPLAPSTVSQHLNQLKKVGLIRGEVDGPRRCYCVDLDVLARMRGLFDGLGAPV